MYRFIGSCSALALCGIVFTGPTAFAAVSTQEAATLKTSLTPLGGERAGNVDGTIPAWDGGYTKPLPGYVDGGRRGIDPFPDEKPLFTISNVNVNQYKDRLNEGTIAMINRYPGEYILNVYPSHRTMAARQWIYDNTFANATSAIMEDHHPVKTYGGIPFPIPKSGEEVMWNHLLRIKPAAWHIFATAYLLTADGKKVLETDSDIKQYRPYYIEGGSWEEFVKSGGDYEGFSLVSNGPPIRAGEGVLQMDNIVDDSSRAWVYLTGQRRIRKLPNACCDTPHPATAGVTSFDEINVFQGRLDRFDWTIVGKKEMYIPYNGNIIAEPKSDDDVVLAHFLNPKYTRWELHRVWIIEANLKPGKRHVSPRSRYFIDEDSWQAILADRYSSDGTLAKTLIDILGVAPDIPTLINLTFGFYDLNSGAGFMAGVYNSKSEQYRVTHYTPEDFSPETLAAEGIR